MKNLMIIALFTSILSTETMFTMHNEELGSDHDQKMKTNIHQLIAIYEESLLMHSLAGFTDKTKLAEFFTISELIINLKEKHLPNSLEKTNSINESRETILFLKDLSNSKK